jgi:hypothetical protein
VASERPDSCRQLWAGICPAVDVDLPIDFPTPKRLPRIGKHASNRYSFALTTALPNSLQRITGCHT